jgi:hypothetical protein
MLGVYSLIYCIFAISKLSLFYNNNNNERGHLKRYGAEAGETTVPLWLAAFLLTINLVASPKA